MKTEGTGRRSHKKILSLCLGITLLFSLSAARAEGKDFSAEFTYPVSDLDNRVSARVLALEGVKEKLWKDLWSYLEGVIAVKNLQLTAEQIAAFVPALASVRVVDEKWNGKSHWIRADLSINTDQTLQSLRNWMRDDVRTRELLEARKKREDLLRKMAILRPQASFPAKGTKKKTGEYSSLVTGLSAMDWLLRGYIAEHSGHGSEAKKYFDNVLELDRRNGAALFHRGLALLRIGKKAEAVRDFTRAIRLNPQSSLAYYSRGLALAQSGKNRQAIQDFSKAIEFDSKFTPAYLQRGRALDRSGRLEEAIDDFTKAIELNPENSRSYTSRGAVYSKLGLSLEATSDFAKAVRLDQKNDLTRGSYESSSLRPGNGSPSIAELDLAISRNPGDADAYFRRGMAYDQLGNRPQALQDFNKAIELNPKNAAAYFMRGLVYGMIDVRYASINDIKVSARLGYKPAQEYMNALGSAW